MTTQTTAEGPSSAEPCGTVGAGVEAIGAVWLGCTVPVGAEAAPVVGGTVGAGMVTGTVVGGTMVSGTVVSGTVVAGTVVAGWVVTGTVEGAGTVGVVATGGF